MAGNPGVKMHKNVALPEELLYMMLRWGHTAK